MSIKLRQLSHLLALHEHGSFVQAAASLHLTQPALSRSIQALENEVGAPLFLREGHGIVPTDLGRVLVQHAREITRMADTLRHEVIGNPALLSEELVVGAGPFPAETIVSRSVARFIDSHPRFKVRVEVHSWDDLLPRLRSNALSLFVAETSTLEREPDLDVQAMGRYPIYFLARPNHPLVNRPSPKLGEIFSYPIAAMARIPPRVLDPALSAIARSMDSRGEAQAFPALLCTHFSVVKQVVASSNTIMVSNLACVANELERGELVVLGVEPWMHLHYGLVTLKSQNAVCSAILQFQAYLTEAEQAVAAEEKSLITRWVPAV